MLPLWNYMYLCALVMFGTTLHLSSYVKAEKEGKRLVLHSDTDIVQGLTKLREEFTAHQTNSSNLIASLMTEFSAYKTSSENMINSLKKNISSLETNNTDLIIKLTTLETNLQHLEKENLNFKTRKFAGSTYIRWGRNVCPGSAELVYKGYMAGKHYNQPGSGTTSECLPFDPTWGKYQDGHSDSGRAYIYGAEIDTNDAAHIFDYSVNNEDMPCAVCKTNTSATLMIPARTNCYSGWTLEYTGYLMAGHNAGNGAYNHICMDQQPEFVPGGSANNDEHILYFVEGLCGSLQCPPYVQGRELACVMCSQ